MIKFTNFYLSLICNNKIYFEDETTGILKDLIVSNEEHPKVTACLARSGHTLRIYDWSYFNIKKIKNKYIISCSKKVEYHPMKDFIYLKKQLLDKQIVDINGTKVVRVNDIRLTVLPRGTFLIAADVGFEGLLRRLGIANITKKIMGLFHINISTRMIPYNDLDRIESDTQNIKLSVSHQKLNTLHPSDLADIIEDLDIKTRTALFDSLDYKRAADVLEEMESNAQISIMNNIPVNKAVEVLEKMPADEAADILDVLKDSRAEELLMGMKPNTSTKVKMLMEYPENSVGSIMSADYIAFRDTMSVNDVITSLRKLKPETDTIYYLYIVDKNQKLIGIVSLRDLIISETDIKLNEIMSRKIIFCYDHDNVDSLAEIISKYSLLAVPVVDNEKKMIGMVIIDDVIYELLKSKKKFL